MPLNPGQLRRRLQSTTKAGALLGVVFGLVFFGLGTSIMVFMWTQSGFHAPPLFFRIFATLIAIPFVAVGAWAAYGSVQALRGRHDAAEWADNLLQATGSDERSFSDSQKRDSEVSYICPACGAPLARGAEVSPHGDVKCTHCGGWFNIHKSGD